MTMRELTVAAAVVRDTADRILIARRPPGVHMQGLWEFPGGKVRKGERPSAALERELLEELDLQVRTGAPITFAVHEEEGLRILLLFFEAEIESGVPTPLEGQEIRWVHSADLVDFPMPPADQALIDQLALNSHASSRSATEEP